MTASSYNVCIYTQPKPLILCGNVFEGRVLKQSESYKLLVSPLQPFVYKGSCEHHYGVGMSGLVEALIFTDFCSYKLVTQLTHLCGFWRDCYKKSYKVSLRLNCNDRN